MNRSNRSIRWNLLVILSLAVALMACPSSSNPSGSQDESKEQLQITPISLYPRVVDYGVNSKQLMGGWFTYCGNVRVPDGNTIDLRESSCDYSMNDPQPPRYYGWVSVENPSNEALTYEWNLYIKNAAGEWLYGQAASASRFFDLSFRFNHGVYTDDCRVTVKVNAPSPRRSKGPFTVWTGRCTYYSFYMN